MPRTIVTSPKQSADEHMITSIRNGLGLNGREALNDHNEKRTPARKR